MADPRWPDNIHDVVYQPYQFSWTIDHVEHPRSDWEYLIPEVRKDLFCVDFTKGATHYHATYVSPSWAKRLERVVQIDNHIFYR